MLNGFAGHSVSIPGKSIYVKREIVKVSNVYQCP